MRFQKRSQDEPEFCPLRTRIDHEIGIFFDFQRLTPSPPSGMEERAWGEEVFLLSTPCRDEVKRRRINSKFSQLPSIQVNPTESDPIRLDQT
jgi:hypothetical protein